MYSKAPIFSSMLLLLLLLSPIEFSIAGFGSSSIKVAEGARPLPPPSNNNAENTNTLNTRSSSSQEKQHAFDDDRGFKTCLPKGFHHTSAPSRYSNYENLGSSMCASTTSEAGNP
ncbi:hypothetical protein Syun_000838 [Stephania yunnanensis]|uniref:Uncharacterized protein n=1 Tax=Stephania yunnanensis TaxID=152371 RepID=A0AAP0Q6I7_9MAGN